MKHWFCCVLLLVSACSGPYIPSSSERMATARAHLQAERYYSTLRLLNDLPQPESHMPEVHLMRGVSYFKLEDYRQAAAAFEQASPRSLRLQAYLAYLYLLLGDSERAIARAGALEMQYGIQPDIAVLWGNIHMKELRYVKAEEAFRMALALDPSSAKAHIGLGHTYLLQRRLGKAEEHYLIAVLLSTDDVGAYLALTNFYTAMQRYDDAEATLTLALKRFRDDLSLRMNFIYLYGKMHRIEEATALMQTILGTMPYSDYMKTIVIRQYFYLNRLEDAYKLILDLQSRNRDDYHSLVLLGEYFFLKGEYELSLSNFNKALAQNINSYMSNYYTGLIHLLLGNIRLSIYSLERSIQNYPAFTNANLILAAIYLHMQKYSLASQYANAVLAIDPRNVSAHVIIGISFYVHGHLDSAKYEFEVVELLEPNHPSISIFRTLIAIQQQATAEAKTYLERLEASSIERLFLEIELSRRDPTEARQVEHRFSHHLDTGAHPLSLLLIGHFYHTRQDFEKAVSYYQRAAAVSNTLVMPYYFLAELEARRMRRREAMAYLRKAIAINPAFAKSYLALGALYEQERDYPRAQQVYEAGLKVAPDDPTLLNNLAWVILMQGDDISAAYLPLRQAVALAPNDPDVQDTLAWWHYLNRDYHQAIHILKKVITTHPAQALYHYHLGMAYLNAGNRVQAWQHLQQALDLGIEAEHRSRIPEHWP